MNTEEFWRPNLDPVARYSAIAELVHMIAVMHPTSEVGISDGFGDDDRTYIVVELDLDDDEIDEVQDQLADTLYRLQVDERVPIKVLLLRNAEREAKLRRELETERHALAETSPAYDTAPLK